MKKLKEKKGISLIILIVTITIMIILATTVILSVSNSGIIEKANKAKQDSDSASIKEYVSILQAEWELMSKTERAATGYSSKEEYVNAKLEDKGYNVEGSEDGWLSVEEAKKVLEIGDVVEYEVTEMEEPEKSQAEDNGYGLQNISNKTDFTWRYIGVSDDGKIMIAPDVTEDAPKLYLSGATGYLNGPDELNRLCGVLYTTDKGTAESMTIEHVNNLLGYTGEKGSYNAYKSGLGYEPTAEPLSIQKIIATKGEPALSDDKTPGKDIGEYLSDYYYIDKESDYENEMTYPEHRKYIYYGIEDKSYSYWLASNCARANFQSGRASFNVRFVDFTSVNADLLFSSAGTDSSGVYALRSVVSLYSNIQLKEVSEGNWKLK